MISVSPDGPNDSTCFSRWLGGWSRVPLAAGTLHPESADCSLCFRCPEGKGQGDRDCVCVSGEIVGMWALAGVGH